jgi:hypothetical protein
VELGKLLQDLHVDVETHLNPHVRFFIPNYHFYRAGSFQGRKGGTAVAVRRGMQICLRLFLYKPHGFVYRLVIVKRYMYQQAKLYSPALLRIYLVCRV